MYNNANITQPWFKNRPTLILSPLKLLYSSSEPKITVCSNFRMFECLYKLPCSRGLKTLLVYLKILQFTSRVL